MTAAALPAAPRRVRALGPSTRTALTLLGHLGRIALWYGAIMLAITIAVPFVIARFTEVEASTLWYARQSAIWFPFSIMIGVAAAYLPVHVAGGMTRRTYVRGSVLAAVGLAGIFAVAGALLLLAERTWYQAVGWGWRLEDGWSDAGGGLWPVALAMFLTFLVADLSGLLVGSVYAAGGGWWGTLTLPLTVGPTVVMMTLMSGSTALVPVADRFGETPALLLIGLVLAAALAVAFQMLSVRRSIAPRRG